MAKAWAEAGRGDREGEVDVVIFTVGKLSLQHFDLPDLTYTSRWRWDYQYERNWAHRP